MNQYHTDGPIFEDELCTAYEEMAYDLDISPASAAEPSNKYWWPICREEYTLW